MKNIELRITHTQLPDPDLVSSHAWSAIILGNPGCVHKLPSLDTVALWHEQAHDKGIVLKIEVPVLFQRHFQSTFAWMEQVMERFPDIRWVLNDYGSLHEWKQRGWSNRYPLSLGRVLNYSFQSTPWGHLTLAHELEDVRAAMAEMSIDNEWTLSLLRECGVDELEVDIVEENLAELAELKKHGFRLNGLLSGQLLAISRSCHAVRLHEGMVGQCQSLCDQAVDIEMVYRWSRFEDQYRRMDREARGHVPQMTVLGNATWVPQDVQLSEQLLAVIDTFAIDSRLTHKEQVEQVLTRFMQTEEAFSS